VKNQKTSEKTTFSLIFLFFSFVFFFFFFFFFHFFFCSTMFKKWIEEGKEAVKKILEPTIDNIHYVEVAPRIFVTALASRDDENVLSKHLRKAHPGRFFVYNLSAHRVRRDVRGAAARGGGGQNGSASATAAAPAAASASAAATSAGESAAAAAAAAGGGGGSTFSLGGDDDDAGVANTAPAAAAAKPVAKDVDPAQRERAVATGLLGQDTEQSLDPGNFDNQVLEFSLPHHAAPFELLLDLGLAVSSWLRADPQHIAVIHSLSAGRAAMAAAVSALFSGAHETGVEAIQAIGRTHARYLRCTNPGQRRYARYAQDALHLGAVPNRAPLAVTRIEITVPRGTPADSAVIVHVLRGRQILFSSEWPDVVATAGSSSSSSSSSTSSTAPGGSLVRVFSNFRAGLALDFTLRAYELPAGVDPSRRRPLFRFMGHTGFLTSGWLRVGADELDDAPAGAELGMQLDEISAGFGDNDHSGDVGSNNGVNSNNNGDGSNNNNNNDNNNGSSNNESNTDGLRAFFFFFFFLTPTQHLFFKFFFLI
jgi:hypothetical protein